MFKKLLFSVVFTLALVFLAEFLVYRTYRNPVRNPVLYHAAKQYHLTQDSLALHYEPGKARHDPELSYVLLPGEHAFNNREFSTTVRINSGGLRDDEASLQGPEIICLGDSYTMGWGVEEEQSFPDLLEELSGLRVLNAGVPSFGTPREFRLLERLDRSKLKYLVIQYCANDLKENMDYMARGNQLNIMTAQRYQDLVNHQATLHEFMWFRYIRHFLPYVREAHETRDTWMPKESTEQEIWTDHLRKVDHFLNAFRGLSVDLQGVPIIVMELSSWSGAAGNFIKVLNHKIEQGQLPTYMDGLDLRGLDVHQRVTREDFFVLDSHILPAGHHKVAEMLWEEIQNL